jgi:hypothetical protein
VQVARAVHNESSTQVDAVRLVKLQALPRHLASAEARGELLAVPPEFAQESIFEGRIVSLPNGQLTVVPVLESLRTSKSLRQVSEGQP